MVVVVVEMIMTVIIGTPDLKDGFHCYCWRKKVLNRQKTRQGGAFSLKQQNKII